MSRVALGDRRDPWLGIELRHLAALSAIESEGTFSEAALSLGYVQSAVSGQLAMLERLTGARLVERSRGPGPQRLTEAGELLLAHSRDILRELESARRGLVTDEAPEVGGLRMTVGLGLPDPAVGPLVSSVLSETSGLELTRVDTLPPDELADALEREATDVALTCLPLARDGIATAEIARMPVRLVVHADSPLARAGRPPTLAELGALNLVAWHEGCEPSRVERELAERGVRPTVVARADGSNTVVSLVAMGLGVALLPSGAVTAGADVAAIELADALPDRRIGLAWLRTRSGERRLRRFVDLACRLREPV